MLFTWKVQIRAAGRCWFAPLSVDTVHVRHDKKRKNPALIFCSSAVEVKRLRRSLGDRHQREKRAERVSAGRQQERRKRMEVHDG